MEPQGGSGVGGRGCRLKVAPTADADGEKEKQEQEWKKKTGERKDYWNRSKVFFGLPHTCVRKTAKKRGRGGAKNLTYCDRGSYEGGGAVGKGNPSQGREFYKTAIVVGGVSCRLMLDATNDVWVWEGVCKRVCMCV